MSDIDDATKGIAWCNKQIQEVEEIVKKAMEQGDLVTAVKGKGWLVQWTEQLQHFIRMAHQHGELKEEVSTINERSEKKRFT